MPEENTNEPTAMEIDEDTSERNSRVSGSVKVMASSGTVGSVSISLHPLVIMNVSEHWTRLRAQEGSDQLGKVLSSTINSKLKINIYSSMVGATLVLQIKLHTKSSM